MKKIISFIMSMVIMLTVCASCMADDVYEDFTVTMQIGNPTMTVNGENIAIDDNDTVPIIVNDRTLLPVRALIESMGGTVSWDNASRAAVLNYDGNEIRLVIDSTSAYLNDEKHTLDVAPIIINDRTMLPIRFIAESFKFIVDWRQETKTVTITKSADSTAAPVQAIAPAADDTTVNGGNVLIAYFSRAGENWQVGYVDKGNTAVIEEYIENKINADVFEITAADPYPESYEKTLTRVTQERDDDARPEFIGEIENIDKYDTVFIGYPIWYGGLPMIMYTFLEEYNMDGKTVIPFSTNGGSGWGSSLRELKALCPNANFIDGFSTAGTNARSAEGEVNEWLDTLALPANAADSASVSAVLPTETPSNETIIYDENYDPDAEYGDFKSYDDEETAEETEVTDD